MTVCSLDDTIVAISTALGASGIGIVRLSGPEAREIATRLLRPAKPADLAASSHQLIYGHIVDPETGRVVDEVLLAHMRAPRTYTRQDVVEINAHGGSVPLREILGLCLQAGARMAREGEFTLRAFLNGRLDLAQAEAVLDVITAKTEASLRVAVDQLGGRLSGRVRDVRGEVLQVLAYLEASIDFGDDVPPEDIGPALERIEAALASLLREADQGMIYREGIRTAIIGRPNVGKSSLLNALLRSDRAIVTPIPGTTRDTLEETVNLQGVPLVLVDTAGIVETEDVIERMGIERSQRAVAHADLVLLMVDGSVPPSPADYEVAALVEGKAALVVVNKGDLPAAADYGALLTDAPHVTISALTGEGLAELEALLLETVFSGQIGSGEAPVASNPRHREAFRRALRSVGDARRALADGVPDDILAIDVAEALDALGQITGETASEELLDTIFGRFCIGK
jgi:tRNA modification GTPase